MKDVKPAPTPIENFMEELSELKKFTIQRIIGKSQLYIK